MEFLKGGGNGDYLLSSDEDLKVMADVLLRCLEED